MPVLILLGSLLILVGVCLIAAGVTLAKVPSSYGHSDLDEHDGR